MSALKHDSPQDAVPTMDTESLQDRLDSLWERYLIHLDQYHQAQQQLSKHMSSVNISALHATVQFLTDA